MQTTKSIVFITGTFLSNDCWSQWMVFFESKGYSCVAPSWPHKEASAEELRNTNPVSPIALNRIETLIEYYAEIVRALPEKPILIGHSLGGLIVQLLLQEQLGIAGVAVHSFPPEGITRFKFSFLKTIWESMGFFSSTRKMYMISFRKWKSAITNGLDCDEQKQYYYQFAIPESKSIVRDIFKCKTKIVFDDLHAPLLLTSGGRDRMVPAEVNHSNCREYKNSNSITDYKEFKYHNHLVFGQPAWAKEADFILYWLQGINI